MGDELAGLDLTAQAELIHSGQIQSEELVEAAIRRLERLDPTLNAVIHRSLERAREQARDPRLRSTPLGGVPIVMKDIGGAEAGQPSHSGMAALARAGYRESQDSHLVGRLRAAGTISLGRTNTPELALLPTTEPEAYGPTHNPWRTGYTAGGSSGGSAAAVAAGIVAAAHASDGGGSIRGPASMCGLVGLKPTRARVSLGPGRGERWSGLSCEFMLTRSVRDCAWLLDLLAGPGPGDPYFAAPPASRFLESLGREPSRLRIGVLRSGIRGIPVEPACVAAVELVARQLESLGHHLEESHPEALDDPSHVGSYVTIVASNTARALEEVGALLGRELGPDDVEPLTWALSERGRQASAPRLLAAIDGAHAFGRRLESFWHSHDLLLTPTFGAVPPPIGHVTSTPDEPLRAFARAAPYGMFTLPFNLSGQPAISLPATLSDAGLPVGVQLVAAYGREDVLLAVADQLDRAEPFERMRAPLYG